MAKSDSAKVRAKGMIETDPSIWANSKSNSTMRAEAAGLIVDDAQVVCRGDSPISHRLILERRQIPAIPRSTSESRKYNNDLRRETGIPKHGRDEAINAEIA